MARYPNHGIVGEEDAAVIGGNGIKWVLGPIGGMGAFITGVPPWDILSALNDGRRPVIGVMNQPFAGERCIGNSKGHGAGTASPGRRVV